MLSTDAAPQARSPDRQTAAAAEAASGAPLNKQHSLRRRKATTSTGARHASSNQPASRKRTRTAAEASNHDSNSSRAAQQEPAPKEPATSHTQQPGKCLPELMRALAACQTSEPRATGSAVAAAAASAAAAAAATIQQMALAAPVTLIQTLLAEPYCLNTLLAAALDTGSSGTPGVAAGAAAALLALSSEEAAQPQHGALLEALAQPQQLQLLISGLQQDSAFAAELVSKLSKVPTAQAQVQQYTGVLLHLCQDDTTTVAVQQSAAAALATLAGTAAGRHALQQHDLAPLLAGIGGGGSSAEAAAVIVIALMRSAAAHEVLLPYVAQLLAAINQQHTARNIITPHTVTIAALAMLEMAKGGAAGRQAVMQHADGLFAAMQSSAEFSATVQQPQKQQWMDTAGVACTTLLLLLRSEGGLQAFLQQQEQQQAGQLGDQLLALLQLMGQEGHVATEAGKTLATIWDTPEAKQALLPHIAELLSIAQMPHTASQALCTVCTVDRVACSGAAGRQAVLQHAGGLVAAMQSSTELSTTMQQPAEQEQLLQAATAAGATLLLLLRSEGGLQAYLQQVQQQHGQLGDQLLVLLQLIGQEGSLHAVAQRIYAMVIETPEGQQALLPHTAELLRFAQPQHTRAQAALSMRAISRVAHSGAAGSQAVMQHLDAVTLVQQQRLAMGHSSAVYNTCYVISVLLSAATKHEPQQLLPLQHVQAAIDALLKLVQHDDAHVTVSAARLLVLFVQQPVGKQLLASPERMAVVIDALGQLRDSSSEFNDVVANDTYTFMRTSARLLMEHFAARQEVPAFVPRMLDTVNSAEDVMIVLSAMHLLRPLATFKAGQLALLPIRGRLHGVLSTMLNGARSDRSQFRRINGNLRQMLPALDAAVVQLQQDQQHAQLVVQQAGVAAAQAEAQHRAQPQCVQLQKEYVAQLQQLNAASTHNQQLQQLLHAASVQIKPWCMHGIEL